jgi:hypothetical protein
MDGFAALSLILIEANPLASNVFKASALES